MQREFNIIIEQDADGYYLATVPELKGCHTQAKTLDTLLKRTREAIALCLEVETSKAAPATRTTFIGIQRLAF